MTQTQNLNGVDVAALQQTIQAIQANPQLGGFQFRAHNQWLGGTHNRSQIKDFYGAGSEDQTRTEAYVMDCGEPRVLTGKEEAANPVEYLLHGLAGCLTTTLAVHAAARGIEIESISSEVEGDIDLRGFMGLSESVPRGFSTIRVKMRVRSDAPADKIKALAQYSPVFNTISQPVNVQVQIEKEQ